MPLSGRGRAAWITWDALLALWVEGQPGWPAWHGAPSILFPLTWAPHPQHRGPLLNTVARLIPRYQQAAGPLTGSTGHGAQCPGS